MRRDGWRYSIISPNSRTREWERSPDLLEDPVIALEVGRKEVGGGIRIAARADNEPVFLEEIEVMAGRSIVQAKGLTELVRVVGTTMERLNDPSTVETPAGAGDQVPQELPKGRAHGFRALKGSNGINSV